jgi:hypothetical protein
MQNGTLVPAELTSKCPYCGAEIVVVLGSYVDTCRGGCAHVVEVTRIDGQIYVAFEDGK